MFIDVRILRLLQGVQRCNKEVEMEINEIRPGMSCMTREGAAYVLEVDRQSLLVLLQREDETIPVQVRSDEILAPLE